MAENMNRIDAVLFDFDGTLMDTNQLILDSWKYAFKNITGEIPEDEVMYRTYGEILADTVRGFFGGTEEDVRRNVEIYRTYQNEIFDGKLELYPGTVRMLEELKSAGYRLGLVTSRLKSATLQFLKEFEIIDYFEVILTADDTEIHKPNPEPVLIALERLGVDPANAAMVGDTWSDMECSRRAGVTGIMVDYSIAYKYNKGPEGQGEPSCVVKCLADLKPLLDQSR